MKNSGRVVFYDIQWSPFTAILLLSSNTRNKSIFRPHNTKECILSQIKIN